LPKAGEDADVGLKPARARPWAGYAAGRMEPTPFTFAKQVLHFFPEVGLSLSTYSERGQFGQFVDLCQVPRVLRLRHLPTI
jgi:hypothetical protein